MVLQIFSAQCCVLEMWGVPRIFRRLARSAARLQIVCLSKAGGVSSRLVCLSKAWRGVSETPFVQIASAAHTLLACVTIALTVMRHVDQQKCRLGRGSEFFLSSRS